MTRLTSIVLLGIIQIGLTRIASANDWKCPITIEPGKGVGVVRLGMTQKELNGTGLPVTLSKELPGSGHVGGLQFWQDDQGAVVRIAARLADLPACVQLGHVFAPPHQDIEALAQALGGCQLEVGIGGNVYHCKGFDLDDAASSPRVWIPKTL